MCFVSADEQPHKWRIANLGSRCKVKGDAVLQDSNLCNTASQNGTISVAHNATAEQREIAREAMLSVIGQADGTLTIAADGEMPERDIPVYIILLG